MKKILLVIICLSVYIISLEAQTLYGTTLNRGENGGGTINKFMPASNNLTVAKAFEDLASTPQYTNLIQANNGKLYGMTSQGGSRGNGVIFSFDPSTSTYSKVKDFDTNRDGTNPYGSLVQASDGKLYGMTAFGGSSGFYGVIFSFDPSSSTYKKLKDFNEDDGGNPYGSLIQANDGKLYGMASNGGSSAAGVIFSFDPSSSTYTKLKDFDNTNGGNPYGSLVEASDGKLYGMTLNGGSKLIGVIFSFDLSSSTYTKLRDFVYTDAGNPYGSLMQAKDGRLYGMTHGGGANRIGVIFSFDPSSSSYTKLKDLDDLNGGNPHGSLIQASDGKLYGMTNGGGNDDVGVIFSFDPSTSKYIKIKDFDKNNGGNPNGSLMQGGNGKLYGMTTGGGNIGVGVIFSFDPSAFIYTKLKNFDNSKSAYSYGALVHAGNGKLYGMTSAGGSGGGTIYSFDPSSSSYTKLKDFNYTNGVSPFGSLIRANDGKLYGMTINGGKSDGGVIFSYDLSSSAYTKLKDFAGTDGYYPVGSLVQASDEKLYGMTSQGGVNQAGVIFSYDPSSSTYTKLKDFDQTGGGSPYGNLVEASNGKLYGLTSSGGSNGVGVIFSFDPSSSSYTKLADFDIANGARPFGSLIQAKDGKLYGMTLGGGSTGDGVIFSYNPSSSSYKKLKDFDETNGSNPYGSLMQASDGKLYGMTANGGGAGLGVIFSYDPSASAFTKLKDYNASNGAHPSFGSAFIEVQDNQNTPPTISITAPANNATYLAPAAHIKLSAAASDADGSISKVQFYNGTTLLHTETVAPYGFVWRNVLLGTYTITAKAYDNGGLVTTSAHVHIAVVPNKPPVVSIIKPTNNQTFSTPGYIQLEAAATDKDGRITRVEFYNGSTLLKTEYESPYRYNWTNVAAGTYTVTAVAVDNWGAKTTSAPVTITVTSNAMIVSQRQNAENEKTTSNNAFAMSLYPNPAANVVNIFAKGLQQNKPATISVISALGVTIKTMQLSTSTQTIPVNVSSLAKGTYTLKITSGNKTFYKLFVKM